MHGDLPLKLLTTFALSLALPSSTYAGGPGPAGAETCGAVTSFAQFSDITILDQVADDYHFAGLTCAGDGNIGGANAGVGPDLVYAFRPSHDCTGFFFASGVNASLDLAFYVVTDCSQLASSCVAFRDSVRSGNPNSETAAIALTAGVTYYFILDVGSDGIGGLQGTATTTQVAFQGQLPVNGCGDVTPVRLLSIDVN